METEYREHRRLDHYASSLHRSVGHVHNVTAPTLPESRQVNDSMIGFMDRLR